MRKVSSDKNKDKDHKGSDSLSISKNEPLKKEEYPSLKYQECVDRAFRIPILSSTTNTLNPIQQQFQNRLI
jgi:hypothetical protein